MLFIVRTTWQQVAVLAILVLASVACFYLEEREGGIMLLGMAGGAATVSREDKQTLGGSPEVKS